MNTGQFRNALKGIGGEFEINRLVGAFGSVVYVIGAHAFLTYEVFWLGKAFDLGTYCLTFPTGLGVAVGAIAGAVALKDRQVASAKVISQTGAVPTPAIDGARVPTGDPPPVDQPAPAADEQIPDYAR